MLFLFQKLTHLIFPIKSSQYRFIRRHSGNVHYKKLLEVGAGHNYDVERFFSKTNDYIKTDLKARPGVSFLDITKHVPSAEYDGIICLNVLEHVYDYNTALKNIYDLLKTNGFLFLSVPLFYPLHDLPHDYWRFSPNALRKLLSSFRQIIVETNGIPRFPYNVNILAIK